MVPKTVTMLCREPVASQYANSHTQPQNFDLEQIKSFNSRNGDPDGTAIIPIHPGKIISEAQ
jgi:hypothetical protein